MLTVCVYTRACLQTLINRISINCFFVHLSCKPIAHTKGKSCKQVRTLKEGFFINIPLSPDIPCRKPLSIRVFTRSIWTFYVNQRIGNILACITIGSTARECKSSVVAVCIREILWAFTKNLREDNRIGINLSTSIVLNAVARKRRFASVSRTKFSKSESLKIMLSPLMVIVKGKTHQIAT